MLVETGLAVLQHLYPLGGKRHSVGIACCVLRLLRPSLSGDASCSRLVCFLFAIAFARALNAWALLYFGLSVSKRTFGAEPLQLFSGLIVVLGMHCLGPSCQNEIPRPFQLVRVGGCFFVFLWVFLHRVSPPPFSESWAWCGLLCFSAPLVMVSGSLRIVSFVVGMCDTSKTKEIIYM